MRRAVGVPMEPPRSVGWRWEGNRSIHMLLLFLRCIGLELGVGKLVLVNMEYK